MALPYSELATLATDISFRGRVKIAAMHFAQYIQNEAPNVTAHSSRYRWAQRCYQQPDLVASEIQNPVVNQEPVASQGAAVSDTDLQTAVELVVSTFL